MLVTRRVEFKVYPNATQCQQLEGWTVLHARLYNACLEQPITHYRQHRGSVSYYDQQNELPALKAEFPEYVALGSHALQETVRRVDRAFQAFFRRVKKGGNEPGFPRFKSARRFKGFCYPDLAGWKFALGQNDKHGALTISNFGALKLRGKPRQWGKPTTLTLTRKSTGEWFASITVRCEPKREAGIHAVGMDLGCEAAITLSDGTRVENPRHLKKSLRKLKMLQKRMSKRKRGGSNREKARHGVAKLYAKVAAQRKHFQHFETAKLVKTYGFIATETLNVKNMTAKGGAYKTGLNRSILDVGMATIKQMLRYKVEETGSYGRLIEVPTRKVKPSQTCPMCGHQHKKLLSERTHACSECGYTAPRDVAAAQVMLAWANNELGILGNQGLASLCSLGMMTQETTPIAVRLGA